MEKTEKWFYALQRSASEVLTKKYSDYEKYSELQVLSRYDVFEQYTFVKAKDPVNHPNEDIIKIKVLVHMVYNHNKAGSIFIHELNTVASYHKSFEAEILSVS